MLRWPGAVDVALYNGPSGVKRAPRGIGGQPDMGSGCRTSGINANPPPNEAKKSGAMAPLGSVDTAVTTVVVGGRGIGVP